MASGRRYPAELLARISLKRDRALRMVAEERGDSNPDSIITSWGSDSRKILEIGINYLRR